MLRTATEPGRLANLDGLRGLAAIAVVLLHGAEIFVSPWVPYNGYLAVDFFFLLSGYVLARSFDERLRAGWIMGFMTRRLIRLYPFIIGGSLIGFLVLALRSLLAHALPMHLVALDTLCSILLVPTPPVFTPTWIPYPNDPPLWSLFYELLANLIYACIAPWLGNRRLLALIAAAGAGLAVAICIFNTADFALDRFQFGGLRVMFSFFLGVGFCRAERLAPARSGRPHSAVVRNLVTVVTYVTLAVVLFSPTSLGAPYALGAIFLVYPILLYLALRFEPAAWQKTLMLFGTISYPVYALHQPFFRLISGTFVHKAALPERMAALAVSIGAILVLSWLLAHVYDAPVRQWLNERLLGTRKDRPVPVHETGAQGPSPATGGLGASRLPSAPDTSA